MKRKTRSVRERFVYDWSEVPVVVDVAMVCIVLGLGDATVKRMCASGELPARKVGGVWRINRADLMKLVGAA